VEETPFDFRIEIEKIGDQSVLLIAGDVDLATAPIVINKVESLFREPIARLALDLGGVTFLDSSGIAALLKARTLSVEQGVPFTIASVSTTAKTVIGTAGLVELFGMES
jgi:anti-sigma B factor antagonist